MIEPVENRSLEDLERLRGQIDRSIALLERRFAKEARELLRKTAAAHGLQADVLLDAARAKCARKRKAPRYANPDDPAQTWNGHGRQPNWYLAAVRSGKDPDDLIVS